MPPLDLNRIRQRQKEAESKKMGNFFKPKEGRNVIRVFSFQHKVTKDDVAQGLFSKDKLGKTVTELDRPVSRFMRKGSKPVIHLSDDDPLYQEYLKIAKKNKDKARDYRPQTNFFLNVVDVDDPDKGVVEYAAPKTVYHEILGYILDPDYGESVLGANGRDFVIEYNSKAEGAAKYTVKIRPEQKCEPLPESLEEGVKDWYDPAVFAELGDLPGGAVPTDDADSEPEDGDDDLDADDEPAKPAAKKNAKPVAAEEDDEDEDLEEDDEDEDLDEDEEEEEPEPKKAQPKKKR